MSEKLTESKNNIDTIVAQKVKAISDEKKSLQIKHERVVADLKCVKNENSDAQKHIKHLEVALKSSQKEIKEVVGTHNKKISGFEIRINDLQNYKIDKMSEEKELKTKIKKVDKKLKTLAQKEAEIKIEKSELKRVKFDENKNIEENARQMFHDPSFCDHSPQCLLRQPLTPPHGPLTEAQYNLNETLLKNEAMDKIKTFIDIVRNFFHYKPAEDIEITIVKLKAVKEIFELGNQQNETE